MKFTYLRYSEYLVHTYSSNNFFVFWCWCCFPGTLAVVFTLSSRRDPGPTAFDTGRGATPRPRVRREVSGTPSLSEWNRTRTGSRSRRSGTRRQNRRSVSRKPHHCHKCDSRGTSLGPEPRVRPVTPRGEVTWGLSEVRCVGVERECGRTLRCHGRLTVPRTLVSPGPTGGEGDRGRTG